MQRLIPLLFIGGLVAFFRLNPLPNPVFMTSGFQKVEAQREWEETEQGKAWKFQQWSVDVFDDPNEDYRVLAFPGTPSPTAVILQAYPSFDGWNKFSSSAFGVTFEVQNRSAPDYGPQTDPKVPYDRWYVNSWVKAAQKNWPGKKFQSQRNFLYMDRFEAVEYVMDGERFTEPITVIRKKAKPRVEDPNAEPRWMLRAQVIKVYNRLFCMEAAGDPEVVKSEQVDEFFESLVLKPKALVNPVRQPPQRRAKTGQVR